MPRSRKAFVIYSAIGVVVIALVVVIMLASGAAKHRTPPVAALQGAAASELEARYGNLYSVATFEAVPETNRAAVIAALDQLDRRHAEPPSVVIPQPSPVLPSISFAPAGTNATSPVSPASPVSVSQSTAPVNPILPAAPARDPEKYLVYTAKITARLGETIYTPVPTSDFVQGELGLDTSATRKIEAALSGKGAARIRELAGIEENTDSLAAIRLVRETAHSGARLDFTATIVAEPLDNAAQWSIAVVSLTPKAPLPAGEPLDKFSGRLLDVTRESDIATLRRLVAQGDETLRRVEQASQRYRAELAANANRAAASAKDQIAPGSLFNGKALLPGTATTNASLQIISLDRNADTVTALLRTDNSWRDTCELAGRCVYNATDDTFTLTFKSLKDQRLITSKGLVLTDGNPITITFQLDGTTLNGRIGSWQSTLERVPDAKRETVIAEITAPERLLAEATRAGTVYRVRVGTAGEEPTAAALKTGTYLRILQSDANTGAITASLEDSTGLWHRTLQGALISNTYRASGHPLRLLSTAADHAGGSPEGIPDAFHKDTSIALSLRFLDNRTFTGAISINDPSTTITLEPMDNAQRQQLTTLRATHREETLAAFNAAIRPAAAFDGLAKPEGSGVTTAVRLRIVDTAATSAPGNPIAVNAILDSIEMPGVARRLHGTFSADTGELSLTTTEGTVNPGGMARAPWFTTRDDYVFKLRFAAGELAGQVLAETSTADLTPVSNAWSIAFSLDGRPATLLPTDRLPEAAGAYLWVNNAWQPLPSNNPRVVHSTLQKAGGLWTSAVSLIKTRPEKQDTGTLTFEGTDTPPSTGGQNVILAFRGTFTRWAGVPVGRTPIEVAPLESKSKGRKRVAELDRLGAAAATFGKHAEPAVIDQPEIDAYLVRVTRPLAPGRYTLCAPEQPFEFEIK